MFMLLLSEPLLAQAFCTGTSLSANQSTTILVLWVPILGTILPKQCQLSLPNSVHPIGSNANLSFKPILIPGHSNPTVVGGICYKYIRHLKYVCSLTGSR